MGDIEVGYRETLYKLRRDIVRNGLRVAKFLEALTIQDVSGQAVDEVLDET